MKSVLIAGAIVMATAVMLGAFGAHGLKSRLSTEMLAVYQTGVEYHFYHALGLLLIGLIIDRYPGAAGAGWSAWILLAGIFLFSGSLYLLALTGIRWLGAITPVGGTLFIAGWITLAVSLWRNQ